MQTVRKSKIVATLGPSTDSVESIKALIQSGVDVFRLNFSHATHEYHKEVIDKIRKISTQLGKEVAILQDIAGPKIRVSQLQKPIVLQKGDILTFCKNSIDEDKKIIGLSYPQIIDNVEVGEMIYISDGNIRVKVVQKDEASLKCEVIVPNLLQSRKGVNFPHSQLNIDAITKKDKNDIVFGSAYADIVAISFVNSAKDILKVKEILHELGKNPLVFAKVETPQAVENIDEILNVSDGVMVARGDMGVELGVHKVPPIQKMIVQKANALCKPVIIATQMLTSMIDSPYPTRAEMSDVANAVLDGADALMLSDETTIGNYPLEVIQVLKDAIIEAEKIYPYYKLDEVSKEQSVVAAAAMMAKNIDTQALICFTRGGQTARNLSKFRTDKKIIASSYSIQTQRQLKVVWGVEPIYLSKKFDDSNELQYNFIKQAMKEKLLEMDKQYIFTFSYPLESKHSTNVIRLMDKESFEYLIEKFES